MNYQLIHYEKQVQEFVDFLPDLKDNEGYFLILIARKKWYPEGGIPSALKLKRETVNCKSKIISTIRQWEVAEGMYKYDELPINLMNLGVYIGFNPKNQYNACFELINRCLGSIKTDEKNINIKSMANDVIQCSNGTSNFIDIDVDIKEGEQNNTIVAYIKSIINEQFLTFIRTSGGFHCLIRLPKTDSFIHTGEGEPDKVISPNYGNKWYMELKKHPFKSDLNIMHHDLLPIVGCNQGKFVPHFF